MKYISVEISDYMSEAKIALDKGLIILGDLTVAYPFDGNRKEKIKAWSYEYGSITTRMAIALDYMFKAFELVEKAVQIEDDEKSLSINSNSHISNI